MAQPRILIVDDDPAIGFALARRLGRLGYEVSACVESGEEAVQHIRADEPDLVLMDVKLQGEMDGIATAEKIRLLSDVPVLYVSAFTDQALLERAKRTEPYGYVVKPHGDGELRSSIEMALHKAEAERMVKGSERRFRSLTEVAPFGLVVVAPDGSFEYCNAEYSRIFGYGVREIPDLDSWFLRVFPTQRLRDGAVTTWEYHVEKDSEKGLSFPLLLKVTCKDSTEKVVSVRRVPLEDNSQILAFRDATAEVAAKAEIVRAKQEWEQTFDAVSDPIMILRGHEIVRANKAMADSLGVTPSEVIDKTCYEVVHDGTCPPEACPHARLLRDGKEHSSEVFEPRLGGFFDVKVSPVFDAEGRVTHSVHVARDITDRKRAQEMHVQSERLKAVEELASGVAHHFNNMLQIILGNADLAGLSLDEGDYKAAKARLDDIVRSSQFGAETVLRLQRFVSVRYHKTWSEGVFDLAHTVRQSIETSRIFWEAEPQKAGISIHLTPVLTEGCMVRGREDELFEVITSLIRNAVEAMPTGGRIAITTTKDENGVRFTIKDTGIGIAQENTGRLFDPFFTTKGYQRVGLGLAAAYGIVQSHGGTISVQTVEGEGTTFTVELPLEPVQPEQADSAEDPSTQLRLRILVIDDVEPLLHMLQAALTDADQIVAVAGSGQDGLDIYRTQEFDVVVSDLAMPEMDGWEVGERIREIAEEKGTPKPPFILLTGWSEIENDGDSLVAAGVDAVVRKPVNISTLMETVQRVYSERIEHEH